MHTEQLWSDESLKEQIQRAGDLGAHTLIKSRFLEVIDQVPWNVDFLIAFADYLSKREIDYAEGFYRRVLEINPGHEYAIR